MHTILSFFIKCANPPLRRTGGGRTTPHAQRSPPVRQAVPHWTHPLAHLFCHGMRETTAAPPTPESAQPGLDPGSYVAPGPRVGGLASPPLVGQRPYQRSRCLRLSRGLRTFCASEAALSGPPEVLVRWICP